MLISPSVTPKASHRSSALERVRFVVPKQGIVRATMSFASRPSTLQARTATKQGQAAVQPAGDTNYGALGVGVFHTLGKALSLDAQNQLAALGACGVLRHKRRGRRRGGSASDIVRHVQIGRWS